VKGMKRSSTDSQWQQLKCPVKRSRQPQSLFHCFRVLSGWTAPKCRQYISIPARTSIRSVVPAQQISKGQVSNKNAATHTHRHKETYSSCLRCHYVDDKATFSFLHSVFLPNWGLPFHCQFHLLLPACVFSFGTPKNQS